MNISGLVLEMLIPGSIVLTSILLVLRDCGVVHETPTNWFVTFLFISASYIIGLTFRHLTVVPKLTAFYQQRLNQRWPLALRSLSAKFGAVVLNNADTDENGAVRFPFDPSNELNRVQCSELINFLRDFAASKASGLWDHIDYQWKLARIARNSHLPVLLFCLSTFELSVHSFARGDRWLGWDFLSLTIAAFGLSWGLLYVYRQRIFWHLDVLVRFGLLSQIGETTK